MEQIPVQQPTITPNSMQEPPQKKINIRKFFNISSWIILFALLPITVLIFLSQDSIPGDFFYPVKRSMENVILAAASVNPATRAAFRTDLTQARFKEAQSLVVSRSNASGLTTFVDEVRGTQLEVASLKNDAQRVKAEEKLAAKIQEYQNGLSTLETKTQQNIIAYQFQASPIPILIPTSITISTTTPVPTSTPVGQASSASSDASAPTPTLIPSPSSITSPLTSTQNPTITVAPTVVPTQVISPESVQVLEQKKIAQTIKETKISLEKIKKDLEENRKEKKENREKRNEDEKSDSSNHQK